MVTIWEIICPQCGLTESFKIAWPTATKRCWRELPPHPGCNDEPCSAAGLIVESESFELTDDEYKLERDLMKIMRDTHGNKCSRPA